MPSPPIPTIVNLRHNLADRPFTPRERLSTGHALSLLYPDKVVISREGKIVRYVHEIAGVGFLDVIEAFSGDEYDLCVRVIPVLFFALQPNTHCLCWIVKLREPQSSRNTVVN